MITTAHPFRYLSLALALCTMWGLAQACSNVGPDGSSPEQSTATTDGKPAITPVTTDTTPINPSDDPSNKPTTEGPGPVKPSDADVTKPEVVTSNPKNNFKGVSPSSEITVQFSEPVKASTISPNSIKLTDSNGNTVTTIFKCTDMATSGASTCSDDAWPSVTLTPESPLLDSESYTIQVTTDIQDLAGNTLRDDELRNIITFKTTSLKTTQIATGEFHILALKENGTLWAWGRNNSGQLGDGTHTDRSTPTRVMAGKNTPLGNVKAIAAGGVNGTSFALVEDPETQKVSVWAWGANDFGQMGTGVAGEDQVYAAPITDALIVDPVAIAAAENTGYALSADGRLIAWGNNYYGQLGDGTLDPAATAALAGVRAPVQVKIPEGYRVKAIASPRVFTLALVEKNDTKVTSLLAWGYGFHGQMGNGTSSGAAIKNALPVQVKNAAGTGPLENIAAISATLNVPMALTTTGELYTWGENTYGGVGDGTTASRLLPFKAMENVTHIGAGGRSTFATTSSSADVNTGDLWGWGENSYLQLLQSGSMIINQPSRIGTLSQVAEVRSTRLSIVILKQDGTVITAGQNVLGQLGNNGNSFHTHHPSLVEALPESAQLSGRAVASKVGKKAIVWGRNVDCELGNPQQGPEVMTPTTFSIPDPVIQVANSGTHLLALTDKGEVWAWGNNAKGQLGLGADEVGKQHCTPQKIPGLSNVTSITAGLTWLGAGDGRFHGTSMAIRKAPGDPYGEVMAWGYNGHGQLGINSTISSPVPVKVQFPLVDGHTPEITQVSVTDHALAVRADGALYAWGGNGVTKNGKVKWLNGNGQLCLADTRQIELPVLNGITNVKQVVAAETSSFILLNDGTVRSCGFNQVGLLGNGLMSGSQFIPQVVKTFCSNDPSCKVIKIAAAGAMAFAITEDRRLWAWGNNLWGQLGVGDSKNRAIPTMVLLADGSPFDNVKDVSTYSSITPSTASTESGVATAIRTVDGVDAVYDWGFLNTSPSFLIWEGEPGFRGTPQTVNWP